LVAAQSIRINLNLMPQALQPFDTALKRRLVAHCARRGVNVNMAHDLIG
jgi:hypothetical protein